MQDQVLQLSDLMTAEAPPSFVVNPNEWTFTLINVNSDTFDKANTALVDTVNKTVLFYIAQGLVDVAVDINKLQNTINSMLSSEEAPSETFHVNIGHIANATWRPEFQSTCAHLAYSSSDSAVIEPHGYKYSWPNVTGIAICSLHSDKAPVACKALNCNVKCTIGFKPDIRHIATYSSADSIPACELYHIRYGAGYLAIVIDTDGCRRIYAQHDPGTISIDTYMDNHMDKVETYYADDFHALAEKELLIIEDGISPSTIVYHSLDEVQQSYVDFLKR